MGMDCTKTEVKSGSFLYMCACLLIYMCAYMAWTLYVSLTYAFIYACFTCKKSLIYRRYSVYAMFSLFYAMKMYKYNCHTTQVKLYFCLGYCVHNSILLMFIVADL